MTVSPFSEASPYIGDLLYKEVGNIRGSRLRSNGPSMMNLFPFTFRNEMPRIKAEIAEEARRRLILHRDGSLVSRHLSTASTFCRACVAMNYLSEEQMQRAAQRYRLGMSRDGGVIFWQIGPNGEIFDGKIMYYRPDCHRDKHQHPTWVSAVMKQFYQCPVDIPSQHCLFGTHLCHMGSEPVAIVEAEKTAVIMSEFRPEYIWVATGGMNELTPAKLSPFREHRMILFPDTDEAGLAYSTWYHIAQEAQRLLGLSIRVSPILELHATREQKARKIDLVDFLFPYE